MFWLLETKNFLTGKRAGFICIHYSSGPNLVTYLNRTPIFEQCVGR